MDELFSYLDSLPEELKRTFLFGLPAVLIPLVGGRPRVLVFLGGITLGDWRPFSPNWITVYSLVLSLIGSALFFFVDAVVGIGIAGFGAMLDRLDGRMAHVRGKVIPARENWVRKNGVLKIDGTMHGLSNTFVVLEVIPYTFIVRDDTRFGRWWYEMNFDGGTDLGKVFDPAADKLKTFVLLLAFAWTGFLSPTLVIIHTIPELLGTLMRRPFYLFAKYQKEPKATAVGKWKALVQWIVMILSLLFYQGWFTDGISTNRQWWIMNGTLIFAILLAVLSVASRLKLVRESDTFKDTLKSIDSSLSHD